MNLLAFTGAQNTITFVEKYLVNKNKRSRDMVFFCIKYIYDQMNIEWWNEEEILHD